MQPHYAKVMGRLRPPLRRAEIHDAVRVIGRTAGTWGRAMPCLREQLYFGAVAVRYMMIPTVAIRMSMRSSTGSGKTTMDDLVSLWGLRRKGWLTGVRRRSTQVLMDPPPSSTESVDQGALSGVKTIHLQGRPVRYFDIRRLVGGY